MRINYLLSTLLLLLFSNGVFAQYDTIVNRMQKEFDAFKKGIELEHLQFKVKNDSIFSAFLKESWESFNVFFKSKPEEKPKPDIQPEVPFQIIPEIHPERIAPADISLPENVSPPVMIDIRPEKNEQPSPLEKTGMVPATVDFYGSSPSFWLPPQLPDVNELSGNEIALYFDRVSSAQPVEQLVMQLQMVKNEMKLNDWAFLQLIKATASRAVETPVEAGLLSWVLLLKSGYNAKIGYTGERVFLMLPSRQEMYNIWYLTIGNASYYIVGGEPTNGVMPAIKVHRGDYPGNQPISLLLKQLPDFGKHAISKEFSFRGNSFQVIMNQNLMDFFKDYPLSDLRIYFAAPLSEEVASSLDKFLQPAMKELTGKQKVAFLLEFTQNTFAYQTDKQQFGREKFFFPDEVFFYPASDCEDRSILFSCLIHRYTGFDTVALSFPGHVNTAVEIPGESSGDLITCKNHSYSVCDPTFLHSPVGFLPKEFRTTTPEIITFE